MGQIRKERQRAGLTQVEVAARSGLKQATVSQIERKNRGDWRSLQAIAKAIAEVLGETPEQVLGRFGDFSKAGAA